MLGLIDVGLLLREPSDGSRIEDKLCPTQSSESGCLGKPLVPADERADFAIRGIVSLKAKVSGREIKLLVVERVVWNVHLAILTSQLTRGIDDDGGVVINPGRSLPK